MAMIYGTTAGVTQTVNNTNEYLFVSGTSGSVVTAIKKYARVETATQTLPDTIVLPSITATPTTWTRYELRLSNTDFARETYTTVTWSSIS